MVLHIKYKYQIDFIVCRIQFQIYTKKMQVHRLSTNIFPGMRLFFWIASLEKIPGMRSESDPFNKGCDRKIASLIASLIAFLVNGTKFFLTTLFHSLIHFHSLTINVFFIYPTHSYGFELVRPSVSQSVSP